MHAAFDRGHCTSGRARRGGALRHRYRVQGGGRPSHRRARLRDGEPPQGGEDLRSRECLGDDRETAGRAGPRGRGVRSARGSLRGHGHRRRVGARGFRGRGPPRAGRARSARAGDPHHAERRARGAGAGRDHDFPPAARAPRGARPIARLVPLHSRARPADRRRGRQCLRARAPPPSGPRAATLARRDP